MPNPTNNTKAPDYSALLKTNNFTAPATNAVIQTNDAADFPPVLTNDDFEKETQLQVAAATPYMPELRVSEDLADKTAAFFRVKAERNALFIKHDRDIALSDGMILGSDFMDNSRSCDEAHAALSASLDAVFEKARVKVDPSAKEDILQGYLEITRQENVEKSGANADKDKPKAPVTKVVAPAPAQGIK